MYGLIIYMRGDMEAGVCGGGRGRGRGRCIQREPFQSFTFEYTIKQNLEFIV